MNTINRFAKDFKHFTIIILDFQIFSLNENTRQHSFIAWVICTLCYEEK